MDWKDVATEILVLVVVSILSAIGAYVFRPIFDDWLTKRKKKREEKDVISDQPSNLITNGVFNELFPKDLITFDDQTGSFRVKK